MDHKFTEQIKQWLEAPEAERDYAVGALYLLKLSGNQIMYKNIITQIDRRHEFIDYQLQKYYNFRVQSLTHVQVEEMQQQVDVIVAEHISLAANADEHCTGKRDDHDSLPDEIKAKYVENLSILQRMRELHLKLRSLSLETALCPARNAIRSSKNSSSSTRRCTPTGTSTTISLPLLPRLKTLPNPKPWQRNETYRRHK